MYKVFKWFSGATTIDSYVVFKHQYGTHFQTICADGYKSDF